MAQKVQFKGFKRVLSTNTAYSGATHDDFLYFVRDNVNDVEGQIWFQGMCYGSCRDSEIDKVLEALEGFIPASGEVTNVKEYIDDLIGGKDASVTGVSADGHVTVQIDEADGALTAATVTTNDIASDAELKAVEHSLGFNGTGYTQDGYFVSGNTVAEDISLLDAKLHDVLTGSTAELDAVEAAVGLDESGHHVAQTGKYISAATTVEGEIVALNNVIEGMDASSVSGESKVVLDVTQEDGKITATAGNLTGVKLDGYAVGSDADVAATDTLGEALGKLQGQINAMDLGEVHVAGQPIIAISEEDGHVSATAGTIAAEHVTVADAQGLLTGETVEAALEELALKSAAITIANADKTINVTPSVSGTDINVNIKSGEKVLAKDGNAGLYTDLDFVKITTGLPETVKERYQLLATDDSQIGVNIDVPKDSHIVSINYITTGEHAQNLEYVYIDASGQTQTTYVDMSELVLETEFASGVTVTNHIAHGVVDPASEKDSNNDSFLTVGADGFKVDGIKDEIDAKIAALDKTDDAAVAGQYVAAIEETNGVVAVKTRANVSEAVLNNYTKGTDATAVAATDSVNEAISKLENQVDKAKAAATTKVVEGTDAGNNMEIVPTTGADSSVTYTVNLTDVASKAALDAEIAARKAVDGQDGQTYAANTGANYISGATSLNDADVKLDTALKAVEDKVSDLDYAGLTNENTKVVTDVKQENGLVSASATTVGDLVITAITAANAKVEANDNLATIAGKLQGQINAMDLAEVSASGAAIVAVSETDGVVSAATGNVDTDHVVLASALTGASMSAATGTQESTVLQQIVDAIDNLGGDALIAVTSTGNTLSVGTPSGNKQNIEFVKETPTDTTVANGHLGLAQNDSKEWYGVMYWINEEE